MRWVLSSDIELAHQTKNIIALRNLVMGQVSQTLKAECLYAERGKHTAVNDGSAKIREFHFPFDMGSKKTADSASKGVPCSSRVVNVFERICPTAEEIVFAEKKRSVFTFLDCDE